MNTSLSPAQRAALLLAQMTLDEKIALVHGCPGQYVGNITNNSRLGIPGIHLSDGPAGVSDGMQGVTALPAPVSLAASWDTALCRQYGTIAGSEARGKGVHVLLGPMMNMIRVPQGGRSFESFSEDPFLAAAMAAAHIQGVQSQGVMANAKHFICNDQEYDRGNENSQVDERTLHEIYFPPFLASVRAGVGSVCSSYNQINGAWASESPLLKSVLKGMWGFGGWVECDWGANFDTDGAATNGLDLEEPAGLRFGTPLESDIQAGLVPQSALNDKVQRLLTSFFRFGIFDNPTTGTWGATVTTPANAQFARNAAAAGIVLLQNSRGLLPLNANSVHSIAVIGSVGYANPIWTGTGSAQVYLPYYISPFAGISNRAGTNILVSYSQGDGADTNAAVQLAAQSDVAIVCVGQQTGEGDDRTNFALPNGQDALVSSVAAVNSNTIVVLYVDAGTLMPWSGQVSAALVAWYPGQEGANALASLLFGDVNPSAKLPVTFPAASNQVPCNTLAQYPGTNNQVIYSEGMLVGYRWYDASNIAPRFPFGLGLSYTTFGYSNLVVGGVSPSGQVQIGMDLTDTGNRAGAEAAQLYLGFPPAAGEPPKQLKGFQKVSLQPGQTQHVTFNLDWQDLAFWNTNQEAWVVPQGTFQVMVGASSRDIRLTGTFQVTSAIASSGLANLALLQVASASTASGTNLPGSAVDGDPGTRWASISTTNSQWLTVDLGAVTNINRLRLNWYADYATSYQILFSNDNTNWTTAYATTTGAGGLEDVLVQGSGRYVQLYATHSATGSGYSVQELEVYSPAGQAGPVDTNPPAIAIITPTNNAVLAGSVGLQASATDNVSVASVQFQLDGLNLGAPLTLLPYGFTWNTANNANGSHQITAVAIDTSNNKATSAVVNVIVNNPVDTNPPAIVIIAPTNNAVLAGSVGLQASATDNVSVASVQFQLDGLNLGAPLTLSPYSFTWNTANNANGTHQLTAIAADTSNNKATSSVVNVTINNITNSPPAVAIWVDDALPPGAVPGADYGDSWTWVSTNPVPYSGTVASQSNLAQGEHQHFFSGALSSLVVTNGGVMFAYVYLDPANPPSEAMLQWYGTSWEHRAYWGANEITFGVNGTASSWYVGPLPPPGQWSELSVPASLVGIEGTALNGMAFTLYGGRATWDYAGATSAYIANGIQPVQHLSCAFTSSRTCQFTFDTVGNWDYMLQRSTDLRSWTAISTATLATGTTLILQDTNPPPARAFYRVLTSLP